MLPHAIIAVNAVNIPVNDRLWDENFATETLLRSVPSEVSEVPCFQELANIWRRRGRTIRNVPELIRCYYSSFTVIFIPTGGRPGLLLGQIEKLRTQITQNCRESYSAKQTAGMLSDSDELGMFMQVAFDHFSRDLETPFDFIEVSLDTNPIPKTFGGNILQLAISMQKKKDNTDGTKSIFKKLSKFVSSCVFLDCVRYRKGMLRVGLVTWSFASNILIKSRSSSKSVRQIHEPFRRNTQ